MQKRYVYLDINPNCVRKIKPSCYSDTTLDGLVIGDSHFVDAYNAILSATSADINWHFFIRQGVTLYIKYPSADRRATSVCKFTDTGSALKPILDKII